MTRHLETIWRSDLRLVALQAAPLADGTRANCRPALGVRQDGAAVAPGAGKAITVEPFDLVKHDRLRDRAHLKEWD